MKIALPLFIIFTAFTFLNGQTPLLQSNWEYISHAQLEQLSNGQHEKVHDAILLANGDLVLVGESKGNEKRSLSKGLCLVIDAQTGREKQRFYYGDNSKAVFKSVTATAFGTLCIAGFIETKQHGKQGLLLEVDMALKDKVLKEEMIGEVADQHFEKIVNIDAYTSLIAGKNENIPNDLWLLLYDNRQKEVIQQYYKGNSEIGSIVGMEKRYDDKVWISGNTAKKGDYWVAKVAVNNNNIFAELNTFGKEKVEENLYAITSNAYGDLLLAGETYALGRGVSDPLLVEMGFDDFPNNIRLDTFVTETNTNSAVGVYQSLRPKQWLTLQHSRRLASKLLIKDGRKSKAFSLSKHLPEGFKIVKFFIFKTDQNNLIVIGHDEQKKRETASIRAIGLKNGTLLAAKGLLEVECTLSDFINADGSDKKYLYPRSRGTIELKIRNTGQADISHGWIDITPIEQTEGLELRLDNGFIQPIPSGQYCTISIPVRGLTHLKSGLSRFKIKIEANNQAVKTLELSIKSSDSSVITTKNGSRYPYLHTTARNATTYEDNMLLNGELEQAADKIVEEQNIIIEINGVIVRDNNKKDADLKLIEVEARKETRLYRFSYQLKGLKEGVNRVAIILEKDTIFTTNIYFNKRKPNLYAIVIGPDFDDLKFTAQDAKDFSKLLSQQKNRSYYDEVDIRELSSPEQTGLVNIQIEFDDIRQMAEKGKIKPNDHIMIFFSGHGKVKNEQFYLTTSDFNPKSIELTSINFKELLEQFLNPINCKKIVFIDACHSGNARGGKEGEDKGLARALEKANSIAPGIITFASSSIDEVSYENEIWENGVFTEALLEAISDSTVVLSDGSLLSANGLQVSYSVKGHAFVDTTTIQSWSIAEEKDNVLTIDELNNYLKIRVPDLLKTVMPEKKQTPSLPQTEQVLDKDLPIIWLNDKN